MAIIWTGGEDIDFPNGTGGILAVAGSGYRPGYARYGAYCNSTIRNNYAQTNPFQGGAVTSAWLSFRGYTVTTTATAAPLFGVSKSGTPNGLYFGLDPANNQKVCLYKYDGTTATALVSESGISFLASTLIRFDIQIANYGTSATVTIYANLVPIITYTGDITVSGMTGFDSLTYLGRPGAFWNVQVSEIVVADEDTRSFGVVTLAPNAAGTTQQWTGAYTDLNETTINDATYNVTNVTLQDQQYNLIDLPAGSFVIKDVMVSARGNTSAGSTATKLAVGVRSGSTISVGTAQTATAAYYTVNQLIGPIDPATGLPWTVAAINALQLNLRSG